MSAPGNKNWIPVSSTGMTPLCLSKTGYNV
ncbi:WPE palindromic element domain-containing protein [Wolbachia endosymbiont of Dactylopius coccus]